MISDKDRRWLAARVRPPHEMVQDGFHWHLNGTLFGMGIYARTKESLLRGMNLLAELIEPSCDRDALLELADELERPMRDGGYSKRIAHRSREALGESE